MIYSLSDNLHFGKYKGVNVLDVFTGVPFLNDNLPMFMSYAIEMIINRYENSTQIKESLKWQNDGDAIIFNSDNDIVHKVSQALIKLIYNHTTKRKAASGEYLLERYNREILSKGITLAPTSGNPLYIEWALKNVNEFCLMPELIPILANEPINAYSHINFNVESNKLIYSEVCYSQYKYHAIIELQELNLSKFEKEVRYSENNITEEKFRNRTI